MRKLPDITVRKGTIEDLDGIMVVAQSFFDYMGTDADEFCPDLFKHTCEYYLADNYGAHTFVALHGGNLVGYYAISYASTYTKRPIVYEMHFAVLPEYKASVASRALVGAVTDYSSAIGAKAVYGGATSGIERFDKSIINMYDKCGFKPSGQIMRYNCG